MKYFIKYNIYRQGNPTPTVKTTFLTSEDIEDEFRQFAGTIEGRVELSELTPLPDDKRDR